MTDQKDKTDGTNSMRLISSTLVSPQADSAPGVRPTVYYQADALDRSIGYLYFDRPDDEINAIDLKMINDLVSALEDARKAGPAALILRSAKPNQFIAGADLNLLLSADFEGIKYAFTLMQNALNTLAALPMTTIAAITGSALGGAYEIALACDWRVAVASPSLRIGLPEVSLGILPAAGGTQRLPRLIGLPAAIAFICGAKRLDGRKALRAGMIDDLVQKEKLEKACLWYAQNRPSKRHVRGGRKSVERLMTHFVPLRALVVSLARKRIAKESKGHYAAPLAALEAISTGLTKGISAGLAAEARLGAELAGTQTARSLTSLLLLTLGQKAPAGSQKVRSLGVLGAGFMGSGIAQVAAAAGAHVRLRDTSVEAVARGMDAVTNLTKDAVRKRVYDRRAGSAITGRISGSVDLQGFEQMDMVIEAVFEDVKIKHAVLAEIEAVVSKDTVIASNTSALPIALLAQGMKDPQRLVGMHFFSPVHRMPLVEVIATPQSDPRAVATTMALAKAMGKTPILVNDAPGFYTTRVISALSAEALLLLQEGATIEEVDGAMTSFGWPVGPFTLADEVGLEVAMHAGKTALGSTPAAVALSTYDLLGEMLRGGMAGKRNNKGFYLYEEGRKRVNPAVAELVKLTSTTAGFPTDLTLRSKRLIEGRGQSIAIRLTLAFINEAVKTLDENILRSPGEGDLGAVLGLGFPPFLGGPFRYLDTQGVELRDLLAQLEEKYGPRFTPSPSLQSGRRFYPEQSNSMTELRETE